MPFETENVVWKVGVFHAPTNMDTRAVILKTSKGYTSIVEHMDRNAEGARWQIAELHQDDTEKDAKSRIITRCNYYNDSVAIDDEGKWFTREESRLWREYRDAVWDNHEDSIQRVDWTNIHDATVCYVAEYLDENFSDKITKEYGHWRVWRDESDLTNLRNHLAFKMDWKVLEIWNFEDVKELLAHGTINTGVRSETNKRNQPHE